MIFRFRKRTKSTYDSYNSLAVGELPPSNSVSSSPSLEDSSSSFTPPEEYWTNGNTVHFLTMPSIETTAMTTPESELGSKPSNVYSINSSGFNNSSKKNEPSDEKMNQNAIEYDTKKQGKRNEVFSSIIAGSAGGMMSCSLFHPFDVVRTKMQAATKVFETSSSRQGGVGATATVLSSTNPKSAIRSGITSNCGPIAIMSHTYKNGGIRAFYTGISLPMAAQAMYKSTILTVFRVTTGALTDWKTNEQRKVGIFTPYELTIFDRFICGSFSGAVNALVFVCPVEYVRNQLIQQHTRRSKGIGLEKRLKGPFGVISKTLKNEGIFGLWRGAGVTLVRDSLGCGGFFIMNEIGKKYVYQVTGYEEGSLVNTLGSGAMAGLGYWVTSLPLDALKTLVQTGRAPSAFQTVKVLVKRDGIMQAYSQLYRGWPLAFSRGSASAAVTLTTYSYVFSFCGRVFV
mmetsp:Transcript_19682/g.24829  ORF Transcript_19682/g.24829 Transcript_19682/m.24829 type:complete len:456 (+) Transcript_19682:103-1470(+)|eukprot:CAMPEP_0203676872 /NCGR_PEP_ID=MMETSP0090-20130426/26086_1 /ASSEMBLY_ACC=CAM_ASM_001088 /TAXON_ID=426623 /ORGANISM="Chaetoceros affinis, Strain CCMP159" /LENGTH=455 /DNA_ID=CAMNT_0050543579 /DNA_START=239 /DNA_END=1606 /DNA_ORIENTATION=-